MHCVLRHAVRNILQWYHGISCTLRCTMLLLQRAEDLRHRVVVAAASGLQQRRQQTRGVALTLAWMVNGGRIGGFGGGSLEHSRQ